jgi:hypothetical protein
MKAHVPAAHLLCRPVLYYNKGRRKERVVPITSYEDDNLRKNGVSRAEEVRIMKLQDKKLAAQERLDKLRTQAKKEVSVAGTVQFRMDEETMLLLMKAADEKKMPLGTLVRMWTVERLKTEGY